MAKKIKLEITEAQLNAIICMRDEMDAMLGVGEPEEVIRIRWIRLVDRMLKNNGFKSG